MRPSRGLEPRFRPLREKHAQDGRRNGAEFSRVDGIYRANPTKYFQSSKTRFGGEKQVISVRDATGRETAT